MSRYSAISSDVIIAGRDGHRMVDNIFQSTRESRSGVCEILGTPRAI